MKEGEVVLVRKTCVSRECQGCGERATKRITFLYDNSRRNPASSGYGKDDISWCSDDEAFTCDACENSVRRNPPNGMGWCATFSRNERFETMFLKWKQEELKDQLTGVEFMKKFAEESCKSV